jgi:hypothetical protein
MILTSSRRAQLDALEQQQTEQEFGVIFDSSTSGPESSSQSAHSRLGLGIHPHEKPLPDIPRGIRVSHCSTCEGTDTVTSGDAGAVSTNHTMLHQMSFSFQPGDDADILAQVVSEDRANKHTSEVHMRQRTPKESGSRSETSSNDQIYFDSAEPSRKKRVPTNPSLKIKSSGKSSHVPRNLQESDPFERGDSSSSIVTAVRDNSGRSANSSQNDTQSGWPNLECKSGSSEAVTAAKRALAISKKNVSSEGNTGSGP